MLDLNLLHNCQNGDDKSWRELFANAYPLSKWVICHTVFDLPYDIVEDIAQETMMALAANIAKINDVIYLKRFVKRVSRNKCIDYIRHNREVFEELTDDIPAADDGGIDDRVIEALHDAVLELKEPCRKIIRSRYLLNLSYKEISQKSGIEIKQIGVRLKRCLAFLRELLKYKNVSSGDLS